MADWAAVSTRTWFAQKAVKGFYAATSGGYVDRRRVGAIRLHNFLFPPAAPLMVDHIDRDRMNNRRSNLQHVTKAQNNANHTRVRKYSNFNGVSMKRGKWRAFISIGHVAKDVGRFGTEIEAARARDAAVIKVGGNLDSLNFPAGSAVSQ